MIDSPEALLFVRLTHTVITSDGRFRGAGRASGGTSGSASGSASGSRKSPKCIFIQSSCYRILRDASGVPEVLLEVLPDASGSASGGASGSRKSQKCILFNVFVVE